MNIFKKIILAVFIFTFLTGCTGTSTLEEMLSPPKLSEEQTEIYNALINSKGQNFNLKYPKGGEYRSAFVFYNLDEEPNLEAIVFYESVGITAERTIWFNFLDTNDDGKWESVYEISVNAMDIERVMFSPIGNSERINIIICYSVNQTEKGFSLIQYLDRVPINYYSDMYTYLDIGDFLEDETEKLFYIKNDRSSQLATAHFYTWESNQFLPVGSVEVDPTAGEYINMFTGTIWQNKQGFIITHKKSQNTDEYGTDVIYLSGNRLANAIYGNVGNSELTKQRTGVNQNISYPTDIDGDGILEFPSATYLFPGYSTLQQNEKLYVTVWSKFQRGILSSDVWSYANTANDYAFVIPKRWVRTVTAAENENRLDFYIADGTIYESDELLLSIMAVGKDDDVPDDWYFYKENTEMNIEYYIKEGKTNDGLMLTEDEINDGFRIFSETVTELDEINE